MTPDEFLSLSIFAATYDQTIESRKRTFPHWGRGLTEETYLERDSRLSYLEHARNGKLVTWVLAPRDNPATMDFKCSCETFRRNTLVKYPVDDTPRDVVGYTVASVFTPPQNRGKGYAAHMMRLLHWIMAPHSSLPQFPAKWGTPPPESPEYNVAIASVLYSDVGPTFYAQFGPDESSEGWVVKDPYSTIWEVKPGETDPAQYSEGIELIPLDLRQCVIRWDQDTEKIRQTLKATQPDRIAYSFLPNEGVAMTMVQRTEFFNSDKVDAKMPTTWGVELKRQGKEPEIATWTIDVRPPPTTLLITRLRASPEGFGHILNYVFTAARDSGCERIEVWNLPKELEEVAGQYGGSTIQREDHLNALKWYGPGDEKVDWINNEKFCWS